MRRLSHRGQTNPFGQRTRLRYSQQVSSSGNRSTSSGCVAGISIGLLLRETILAARCDEAGHALSGMDRHECKSSVKLLRKPFCLFEATFANSAVDCIQERFLPPGTLDVVVRLAHLRLGVP